MEYATIEPSTAHKGNQKRKRGSTEMKLRELKKGEWFTLKPIAEPKANQVYIREDYDRAEKKYVCGKFSDISASRLLKPDTIVYTEFVF